MLVEEIRKMIEDYLSNTEWTSASPGFINRISRISSTYDPDPIEMSPESTEPIEPEQPGGKVGGFGPADIGGLSIVRSGVSGVKNPIGAVTKFIPIAKLIPIIGTIIAAPIIIQQLAELLQAPGMPFDKRFRRNLSEESLSSVERDEKAGLRQGLTLVRITSTKTFRGERGIGQTGQVGITGIARYDNDFESFQKGVLP